VSKQGEPVDDSWFRMKAADLIMVLQGKLKFEFGSPDHDGRVLGAGRLLVLPPRRDAALTGGREEPVRR